MFTANSCIYYALSVMLINSQNCSLYCNSSPALNTTPKPLNVFISIAINLFFTFSTHFNVLSYVYNITLLYIPFLLHMFLLCSYFIFFHMFVFFTCIFVVFSHNLSHATKLVQLAIYLVAAIDRSHLLAKYVHQKVDNG